MVSRCRHLLKTAKSNSKLGHIGLSVHEEKNSASTEWIFMKFGVSVFIENLSGKLYSIKI